MTLLRLHLSLNKRTLLDVDASRTCAAPLSRAPHRLTLPLLRLVCRGLYGNEAALLSGGMGMGKGAAPPIALVMWPIGAFSVLARVLAGACDDEICSRALSAAVESALVSHVTRHIVVLCQLIITAALKRTPALSASSLARVYGSSCSG